MGEKKTHLPFLVSLVDDCTDRASRMKEYPVMDIINSGVNSAKS